MNMNSHLNMEPFKGQGQDTDKWFAYFERYTIFMNLNEQRAALALPFFLKGVAKSWYESLQETQRNLGLLKTAFINRFKNDGRVELNVLTVTQKKGESAEEYFSRFMDAAHGKELPENLKISIIMKGLLPEMISLVMPQNPRTLDDLRQAMVLAEETTKVSARTGGAEAAVAENSLKTELQFLRSQISEVLAFQQSQKMERSTTNHAERYANPRPFQPQQYRHQANRENQTPWKCGFCGGKQFHIRLHCPASGKTCNFCKKKGHFQNECRSAKRTRPQN